MNQNSIKYFIPKILVFITLFLCAINTAQAQSKLYIMSYGGPFSASDCNCTYFSFRVESNGVPISPISVVQGFLIYDKRPTFYDIVLFRPDSELCSGYCHDGINEHYGGNINADCTATLYDAIGLISNYVLTDPGADNSFCDKINLKATGCTTPEKFYWEYRIEGGTFQPTNVSTTFNETFQFNKSAYLPETYIGNIDFRVLIDSDAAVTGEEVYSNITSYNVIPCPPFLTTNPVDSKTSCIYKNDGKVTLSFNRTLVNNERFVFNFYNKDNALLPTPAYTIDSTNKIYTFLDFAQGDYYIKYQTFIGAQQTSTNALPNPTFNISSETALSFEIIDVQPQCNNGQGKIKLIASGGSTPYYYTIDSGPEVQFTSPTDEIDVSAGQHSIKVRDAKSCIDITGIQ
ncbi:SprB-like repeat protein [Flavobacterium sp. 90]|uniref:hypothetical protein n=1 Tax=unclassified Flavobacterium TaxID=196869 RepID=UPI000EB58DD8|nr:MULTISPECIES: hypothetical protein [unclassified Flavobacterium]RKR08303.1 SprB-like repeat protein [Flavobacterium sp. 81]TCK57491.1 SprB-like repeat protein [Flavobacterium sp. 90]